LKQLLSTSQDFTVTFARLVLGIIFFAHGAQLALGWYGGHGWTGTMYYFTQVMHIPTFFAALAILAQFLGGFGLTVGLLGRLAALGIAMDMLVAIFTVHLPNGLFMNWFGAQKGEGYEFHLLVIAVATLVIVKGSGAVSIDRALAPKS
jgi:putative oxidoreductase